MTAPAASLALVLAALLAAPATPAAPTPASKAASKAAAEEIAAIRAELDRGLAGLKLEGAPAAYRAEARMVRADLLSLDGSYGGIITNVQERQATGVVEIRVGSSKRDNSNYFAADSGVARFDASLQPAPAYTRKRMWLALDRAFRGSTIGYAQKINTLERLAGDEQPPDLSDGPDPVEKIDPPATTAFDREGLAAMVGSLSARFADWPTIDNGDVHVQLLRTHETVVDTEGVALLRVRDRAVLSVVADTRAKDGMHLDHSGVIHLDVAPPADGALLKSGEKMVDRVLGELRDLARAPMIDEEYDGPILFSSRAAAQLLASTVATEASGSPAPLGDSGPMVELEPDWQARVGRNVMPPWIDLVDDPRPGGFGSYALDAQGFTTEPLDLVKGGVLNTLLMTRTPNAKIGRSNARARMSPSLEVGPAISNLDLDSRRRGLSPGAMRRELMRRAHEDGYDIAYVIEILRDGSVLGPVPRETAAAFAGTGKITLPIPALVYRVDGTGKRTLVRGAILAPASMRVLRRIRAVGQTRETVPLRIPVGAFGGFGADVGMDGILSQTVDVQVTTPSLLIEGMELLVERGEHERLPTLDHPLRRKSGKTTPPAAMAPKSLRRRR